jgi:peptidoglycan/LPS O-acetylase OafA/YrhL
VVTIFAVMVLVALGKTQGLARPSYAVLGALTYPLYLIHAHIGFIIFERLGPHLDATVLVVATMLLMTAIAAALHYLIEKPLAPKLKRLLQRLLPAQRAKHSS